MITGILLGGVAVCLALQACLTLLMEVNWDEFFYLSHIYEFQAGAMTKVLQSLHVHILGWLTALPGDEVAQIEVGRFFMLACFTCTCGLIYLLSRSFASKAAALVAVLVFTSAGYSIIHGASLRADPLAAFLTMASLVVLARARVGLVSAVAGGVLAGVAGLITIKIILYAPAFLGIAAWRVLRAPDRRAVFFWLGGSAIAAVACFALLYVMQLGLVPKASNSTSRASLGNAAETQTGAGLLPRSRELIQFIVLSPLQSVLLLTGVGVGIVSLRNRARRPESLAILGCGATLLCLLLYRNAFPYFFPFILAPSAILAALAVEHVSALRKQVVLLAVGLVVPAAAVAAKWSTHGQERQEQVIAAVHRMFPYPVAYIDRNSMIASFPKRGFFMSTWGLENYRRASSPLFARILANDVVPLVVANGPALENALGRLPGLPDNLSLLDQDKQVLRENYIPHWGPLFVAGKVMNPSPQGSEFMILIPGTYTVEGGSAEIDGKAKDVGQTVELARGLHSLKAAAPVTLRWGDQLYRPAKIFTGPVYRGF